MFKHRLFRKFFIVCLAFIHVMSLTSCAAGARSVVPKELGIPSAKQYPSPSPARCAWDMVYYDGVLYIGGGDYDANSGPVSIHAYDPSSDEWSVSGTVPEEEINRFADFNGQLASPGIDSREDWSLGSYYVFSNGEWIDHRTIPGGIHVFDILYRDGDIYAGIDVEGGGFPAVVSHDGGQSFEEIPFERDGVRIDTAGGEYVRTYDFFELNGELYATYYFLDEENPDATVFDIYRFDNERGSFVYHDIFSSKFTRAVYSHRLVNAKVVIDGTLYFTTGRLYSTKDFSNYEHIEFPNGEIVCDLQYADNTLYALCGSLTKKDTYTVSVFASENGGAEDWKEIINFKYSIPAVSFAITPNAFYFGMGTLDTGTSDLCGMILSVER